MKSIIIILVFFTTSAQAQTYTSKQLSDYTRKQWKTNDSLRNAIATLQNKADIKDTRDDERNAKIELLFWENKRLKERLDSVQKFVDSSGTYLDPTYFTYDPKTKMASVRQTYDTVVTVIMRGKNVDEVIPKSSLLPKNFLPKSANNRKLNKKH